MKHALFRTEKPYEQFSLRPATGYLPRHENRLNRAMKLILDLFELLFIFIVGFMAAIVFPLMGFHLLGVLLQ